MRRREFITFIGGTAAAWPLAARAQQPAKMKRIAMVAPSEPVANLVASYNRHYRAFFDEVSRLGFVQGKNLIVERYSAGGQPDRFAQLARDVVDTRPDAIYLLDATLAFTFKAATTTIPIVTPSADPIAMGLVSNIARPGGNLTGTSIDAGIEMWGKRIGLLKETLPSLANIGFIVPMPRKRWNEGGYGLAIRQAAKASSIRLNAVVLEGTVDEAEYRRAFAAFEQDRPDALMVSEHSANFINRIVIVELAAKHRLPAMYTFREIVEDGGLMAYAVDLEELSRSTGSQISQILNGTNPGDIPFSQVTRFELAINLKTAKSLGLEFPATLLGSANFIVE
jgi:putative tryptophan/tyrosine transport system substrate-binding protein